MESNSIVTMDRAYVDYQRLYAIHRIPAYFVVRAKRNMRYRRISSQPVDKSSGIRADQTITFTIDTSKRAYPETLRRVTYFDAETNKRFVFLTNHFGIPAKTVADIYRQRWLVELFFRWIKQHLRIKRFYGTSPNAVKTQIWVAISIYLLVAIVKKQLNLPASLHTILQILEVNVFEKRSILQIVSDALKQKTDDLDSNQLNLFDS